MQKPKNRSVRKLITSTAFAGMVLASPAMSDAQLGDKPLKKGMSDPDVKQLQDVLKEKGYFYYSQSTGYFGSITKEAVIDFQNANKLKTTGIVQEKMFHKLNANTGNQTVSHSLLRIGSRGQAVTDLQSELKKRGLYKGNLDSIFGPLTASAVKDFQHESDLKVDGIVGPMTFGALNGQSSSKETSQSKKTTSTDQNKQEKTSSKTTKKDRNKQEKASTGKHTAIPDKILRVGSRGQAVIDLQKKLDAAGYYTYKVDGIYGSITASAVRKFQRANHLKVDGIAGPKTFSAMYGTKTEPASDKPKQSTQPQKSSHSEMLSFRDRGSAVKDLQKKLKKVGLFHEKPTDYFGVHTDKAVQQFQAKYGLTVDGIVGPKTWDKLTDVLKSGVGSSDKSSSFNVMNLIADASHLLGVPYQWGGVTPSGFDCSGFVQYAFRQNGINLPRTVATMWHTNQGSKVSQNNLHPGDVVFFENTYKGANGPSHNGIYIGGGQFIQSGTSHGVAVSDLSYWISHFDYLGAKRFF